MNPRTAFGPWLALGLALGLAGCLTPNRDATVDRIARCGAGIELSESVSVAVFSDLKNGRGLRAERVNLIKAAILDKAGANDVEPIYRDYLACIRSEGEVEQLVADLKHRRAGLEAQLKKDQVDPKMLPDILKLADAELSDTEAYRFTAARNDRRSLIIALYQASKKSGADLTNYGPYMEFRFTGGRGRNFGKWCSTYAGKDPLCKEIPTHDPMVFL